MPKVPSMSSKDLTRLLEKGGAIFVRQGSTDHAIYSRVLRTEDTLLLFKWERKVSILYTANGFKAIEIY